jgi:hypothetical protein
MLILEHNNFNWLRNLKKNSVYFLMFYSFKKLIKSETKCTK